ncbi:lactosylceramide 4-alpha-galactosyltransferase-like [Sitodiplosis mosellana]|uniref:lactosylceramide 4-alpha-galactosyltransferase-like n=1 Tax=Sitodiplosis mosellana TaxID=263140 RepID=UPI002443CA41|nr:lactosylceramide 4-alpha-galactosyltransferase-like [Sitodiplosis mosellana]
MKVEATSRPNCLHQSYFFRVVLWSASKYSLVSTDDTDKPMKSIGFLRYRKQIFIGMLVLVVISIYLFSQYPIGPEFGTSFGAKSCYEPTSTSYDDIILFEDIYEAEKQPTPDRSIFFIETSCVRNGLAALNARQACAVESAARCNPDRDVFLLFPSQVGFSESLSRPVMKSLRSYHNIHFRRVNYRNYSIGTPAEQFFQTDKIFKSTYFIETFSDLLRYLTLYRFGGIYLDTDTVTQQSFNDLPANFAGNEKRSLANGVMGFDRHGRKILELTIKNMFDNFDPYVWGNTGPQVLTGTLLKICNVTEVSDMKPEICEGFNVMPKEVFYPIHYSEWERYFDADHLTESMEKIKQSIAIHVWNKLSLHQPILKDFKNSTIIKKYGTMLTKSYKALNPYGETAYGAIAKMECPQAYGSSGDLF